MTQPTEKGQRVRAALIKLQAIEGDRSVGLARLGREISDLSETDIKDEITQLSALGFLERRGEGFVVRSPPRMSRSIEAFATRSQLHRGRNRDPAGRANLHE